METKKIFEGDHLCLDFVLKLIIQAWIDGKETEDILKILLKRKETTRLNLQEVSFTTIDFLSKYFDFDLSVLDIEEGAEVTDDTQLSYYFVTEYLSNIPYAKIRKIKKERKRNLSLPSWLNIFPKIFRLLLLRKNKKFLERKLFLEKFVLNVVLTELVKTKKTSFEIRDQFTVICEEMGVFQGLSDQIWSDIFDKLLN